MTINVDQSQWPFRPVYTGEHVYKLEAGSVHRGWFLEFQTYDDFGRGEWYTVFVELSAFSQDDAEYEARELWSQRGAPKANSLGFPYPCRPVVCLRVPLAS